MSCCDLSALAQPPKQVLLEGRYTGCLTSSKGRPKYLQLQTEHGEQEIKLPDYVGHAVRQEIELGTWVRVWARQKDGRLKAVMVVPISPKAESEVESSFQSTAPPVCTIQVCKKGSCYKQGALAVWQALQDHISKLPAHQRVQLEATGCLKACKQGPNLRIGATAYHRVQPERVALILHRHLPVANP